MKYRGLLSEYAAFWETLLRLSDAMAVLASGWMAAAIYLGGLPDSPGYMLALILAVLLCLVVFPSFGLYRPWRGISLGHEIRALTLAWLSSFGILSFLAFITKTGPDFSRGWFLVWLTLAGGLLLAGRIALRLFQRRMRKRGFNLRRIAIVGTREMIGMLARRLSDNPWIGLVVVTSIPVDDVEHGDFPFLPELIRSEHIEQVWIALPLKEEATIHRVQYALRHSSVDLRYVPDISSFALLNHSVSEIAGLPVISLSMSGMDSLDRMLKSIEDKALSVLILVLASPLMIMIAAGVKLSSPGPVLFRQRRVGLGGEIIEVLKFRTMRQHAEQEGTLTQARRRDPRITRFGSFLRKNSLDELPQFINVLVGDMSIVGPRPHALEHDEQFKQLVDRYAARLKVKPGITGWAQVNGFRGETRTLDQIRNRVELDLYYMEHWSLGFDLKIIFLTLTRGMNDPNAY